MREHKKRGHENEHERREKHEFWKRLGEKVEHYNAKLIPFALVLLAAIIIYELFLHYENHTLELVVKILDGLVIAVFVVDLFFLAIRAKSVRFFFRNSWLDVLAVFPFSLFFEMVNALYRVVVATERIALGQAVAHETIEVGKEVSKEARILSKSGKAAKVIRIIARIVRIVTKSRFFTRFHHARHHAQKQGGKRKEKDGKKEKDKRKKEDKKELRNRKNNLFKT
ncbi:MAG: hypothetical protein AB1668_03215 [Nanoarchaeota archaeon]